MERVRHCCWLRSERPAQAMGGNDSSLEVWKTNYTHEKRFWWQRIVNKISRNETFICSFRLPLISIRAAQSVIFLLDCEQCQTTPFCTKLICFMRANLVIIKSVDCKRTVGHFHFIGLHTTHYAVKWTDQTEIAAIVLRQRTQQSLNNAKTFNDRESLNMAISIVSLQIETYFIECFNNCYDISKCGPVYKLIAWTAHCHNQTQTHWKFIRFACDEACTTRLRKSLNDGKTLPFTWFSIGQNEKKEQPPILNNFLEIIELSSLMTPVCVCAN